MKDVRYSTLLCLTVIASGNAAASPTLFLNGGASSVSIFSSSTLSETGYVAAPDLARSVALSPDGTKAYIAAGRIFTVDTVTQRITGQFASNDAKLLRVSPNGSRLYAANVNGSVWVYDTTSGSVIKRIPLAVKDRPLYAVSDLTVSADGSVIALGSVETLCGEFGCPPQDPPGIVSLIDAQSNTVLRRISVSNVSSLAVSGDNATLYVANQAFQASDSNILKFNIATGQAEGSIAFAATRLALDAAAGRLYAGTSAVPFQLGVFATTDDTLLALVPLSAPVAVLSFTPDHTTVLAGGCITTITNTNSPCPLTPISTATWQPGTPGFLFGKPADLAVSPDSEDIWVANGSPLELTAVDTATNRVSGSAETNYSPLETVVLPGGNKVYTANGDGTISVIDGQTLARVAVIGSPGNNFPSAGQGSASPDGHRAYVILNRMQVVDTATDQIVGTIDEFPVGSVVSPDSQTLYTFDAEFDEPTNRYRLFVTSYSTTTLAVLHTLSFLSEQLPTRLFVSPDGNTLYMMVGYKTAIIDSAALHLQSAADHDYCSDAALSPDGTTLYCLNQPTDSSQPDTVLALATATGAVQQTYQTGVWAFGHIAITPDGSKLYLSLDIPQSPGILEQIDVANGHVQLANTRLSGKIAIE